MASTSPARPGRVRPGRTARTRILGWYVLLLAVSLAAALLIQRAFLLDRVVRDTDAALDQEVEELGQLATGTDPETGEPFGGDVAAIFDVYLRRNVGVSGEGIVTFVDGERFLADIPGSVWADDGLFEPWAAVDRPVRDQLATVDGPVRFVAVPLQAGGDAVGTFVAAVALEDRLAQVDAAVRLAALIYGSIFLVASLMAWLAAGQVLRPLKELREATETISESDLTTRIDVRGDDEIAQLASNFNRMLERLQEAFALQRRFVDDAGHELRTPITIIRGQLDLLDDAVSDPDERAEVMDMVDGELERMSRIVEDLLVLAREQQPDFVQRHPVDLDAFVEELGQRASALARRSVAVELPDPVVVQADDQRLEQAVMNLVRNVLEHCPPETGITIGARLDPDGVVLWVHDDGPGIPEDEQGQVFERFGRGGASRRATTGAGLGLAIVAAVARGHGGWVELASEPGATTFTLVFPPGTDRPGESVDGVAVAGPGPDDATPDPEDPVHPPTPSLHR
ncbi:sensor histidine kinase [Salsipaludibacter albus]|uniref:sensor histidine kinase n=1 Tax=Salsipaludibacter albus TaxID=2849650 RepID=UPI001EE3A678|nr:HAMP domain-containing sensor histidine kinase [Salsipaludibacter albus]MBY5163061.1 HAMP domain-containing histidine kinase [Salsipaludibacter albus]